MAPLLWSTVGTERALPAQGPSSNFSILLFRSNIEIEQTTNPQCRGQQGAYLSCVVQWNPNVCGPRLLARPVCDKDEGMVQGQGRLALQMPGTGLGHSQSCSRAQGATGLAVWLNRERAAGKEGGLVIFITGSKSWKPKALGIYCSSSPHPGGDP